MWLRKFSRLIEKSQPWAPTTSAAPALGKAPTSVSHAPTSAMSRSSSKVSASTGGTNDNSGHRNCSTPARVMGL